jgi:uncharacterized membrane protein
MNDLPLHPVLVHLPIGLAILLPPALLILLIAIRRNLLPRGSWWLAVLLAAALLAGGFAAKQSGENEEEKVEPVVPEAALHDHEEAGERLVVAAGVTFILVLAAAFVRRPGLGPGLQIAAFLASAVTLALAVNTGHLGGRLVYVHGAARAYVAAPAPAPAEPPDGPLRESPDRD